MTRVPRLISVAAVLLSGLVVFLLGTASTAAAHPLSTSAVLLDVEQQYVTATIELPLDQLSVARDEQYTPASVLSARTLPELRNYVQDHMSATDATGGDWTTQVTDGRVEKVDGVDNLVLDATLTPSSGMVGDFVLHYDAVIDQLISHRAFITARYGHTGSYTTLAMLSWQTQSVPVASTTSPPPQQEFLDAMRLGVHHIASGSDHLLFLLMLLLPAPLIANRGRWVRQAADGKAHLGRISWRVVHIVTAFAVGHSITLALSALGWIDLPSRMVECGIAVSVLVSAIHAIRPLVHRGEVLIAGGFGLLHGLAFAAILQGLDLSQTGLLTTLLGFNVGIELTQLIVVALVMPSLILLSRKRTYAAFRMTLAVLGALLATCWLAEHIGIIPSNPTEFVGDLLVDHPFALAGALAVLAVIVTGTDRAKTVTSTDGPLIGPSRTSVPS